MSCKAITITDRIATGDNKYDMATLSDGRVALTPHPDSVTEAGTDINKALLQPIVDWAHRSAFEGYAAAILPIGRTERDVMRI